MNLEYRVRAAPVVFHPDTLPGTLRFRVPDAARSGDTYVVTIRSPSAAINDTGRGLVGGAFRVQVGRRRPSLERLHIRCLSPRGTSSRALSVDGTLRCWAETAHGARVNTDLYWSSVAPETVSIVPAESGGALLTGVRPGKAYVYALGAGSPVLNRISVRVRGRARGPRSCALDTSSSRPNVTRRSTPRPI